MQKQECYKSTGLPKVKRSPRVVMDFLRSRGFKFCPRGYVVDHIVPLWLGGADTQINLQLITKSEHRIKSAREASIRQKLLRKRNGQKQGISGTSLTSSTLDT